MAIVPGTVRGTQYSRQEPSICLAGLPISRLCQGHQPISWWYYQMNCRLQGSKSLLTYPPTAKKVTRPTKWPGADRALPAYRDCVQLLNLTTVSSSFSFLTKPPFLNLLSLLSFYNLSTNFCSRIEARNHQKNRSQSPPFPCPIPFLIYSCLLLPFLFFGPLFLPRRDRLIPFFS